MGFEGAICGGELIHGFCYRFRKGPVRFIFPLGFRGGYLWWGVDPWVSREGAYGLSHRPLAVGRNTVAFG